MIWLLIFSFLLCFFSFEITFYYIYITTFPCNHSLFVTHFVFLIICASFEFLHIQFGWLVCTPPTTQLPFAISVRAVFFFIFRSFFALIFAYIFVNNYSTAENNLTVTLRSPPHSVQLVMCGYCIPRHHTAFGGARVRIRNSNTNIPMINRCWKVIK